MTSPFLLARKPKEEQPAQTEVGQTVRRPVVNMTPLQTTTPQDVEPKPLWQVQTDAKRAKLDSALALNTTVPTASNLREGYSNVFPVIKAIGETAQSGQIQATAVRTQREMAVQQAKLAQAAADAAAEAYRRTSQISTGAAGPTQGGTTYSGEVNWDRSDAAVADLMRKAGFPEKDIGMGLAIAFAESSFRENASHLNTTGKYAGTVDQGLFQINTMHKGEAWYPSNPNDPWQSVLAAKALYDRAGGNWGDWTTYNAGLTPRAVPTTRLQVTSTPTSYGGVSATANGTLRNAVVNKAQVVYNLPYVWGGDSLQTGVDCSGLVQQVYKQVLGITTPRQARAQAAEGAVGHRVSSVNQLQPGDLVAFKWAGGYAGPNTVSHIAIYAGNGEIIEAYGGDHGRRRALTNSSQDRGAIYLHVTFPGE